MMNHLTPAEREIGRTNFLHVVDQLYAGKPGDTPADQPFGPTPVHRAGRAGMTRRDFLVAAAAGGATAGGLYFGYTKIQGSPVRAGLIGTGDEGLVLLGESNPEFIDFIAYSDIRPSSIKRAMEENRPGRMGFKARYGSKKAAEVEKRSKDKGYLGSADAYKKLLQDPDIEAVVIALPLHLHAQATIDALKAGKHVLCEKLMARSITDAKKMIAAQRETNERRKAEGKEPLLLAVGHQRHYSILYDAASDVLEQGLLGDIKHIRALWHRNNTWPRMEGGKQATEGERKLLRDSWRQPIPKEDKDELAARINDFGYKSIEELIRWRLYQRTGGGLMAELGSHQLDACSIFLGKKPPLSVVGVGGKFFYDDDREVEDHVYCSFEFPGKNYDKAVALKPGKHGVIDNDIVVVTYSSINTNSFEGYGETVMGTLGTMVVDAEKEVLLYKEKSPEKREDGPPRSTYVKIIEAGGTGAPTQLDSSGTAGGSSSVATRVFGQQPISKGYREEMEHLAYCIREKVRPDDPNGLKCTGEVALADAVIALTANLAMARQSRILFQEEWFKPEIYPKDESDTKGKLGDPWTDPRVPQGPNGTPIVTRG